MTPVPISLRDALIPVVFLICLLGINVFVFGDNAVGGSNQFALLLAAAVAVLIGHFNKVSMRSVLEYVSKNVMDTTPAILILLMVGALAGTWLISGIVPAMIYYGLQILNAQWFYTASVLICCIVSVATGSSWTTSATIGIALIGIATGLGLSVAITAGAVLSGAYFGDKMSPLSDTTNLAPAVAGTDLYTHIRYMTITTIPSILLSLVFFTILGFAETAHGVVDEEVVLELINSKFHITPWLFAVPLLVIVLIFLKTPPVTALLAGTLLGAVTALIFQQDLLQSLVGGELTATNTYQILMNSITSDIAIPVDAIAISDEASLDMQDLFQQSGMAGMLNTIWLIICAMTFGGAMEAIGALHRIAAFFLSMFQSVFGIFASTVATCLALNITASDQYLSIVVSGKMFQKAFEEKNLAPENLSRTLEDSATVTSVLVPWNTCGAYHSKVLLGESGDMSYIPYAFFNYISPFMTLLVAAIGYKIRMINHVEGISHK